MDCNELLSQLISIDSVNPGLVPGAAGETKVAEFIERWLKGQGITSEWVEPVKGRPSIVATLKGSGGGASLMFNGHIDVVGTDGYEGDPFDPKVKDGRLYGRGSSDMKSGVAAMMTAFARLKDVKLKGDVILTCVADEEHASIGTQAILDAGIRADAAIVCEPVGFEIVTAHKGFIWFDVEFTGRAAHGSRPDKGVDAIVKAGKFLNALSDYADQLASKTPHLRLGSPSVHASLISGGNELSTYPSECKLSLERRTIPGETIEFVMSEIQAIIDKISRKDPEFKATLSIGIVRNPYECDPDANIISILSKTASVFTGSKVAIGKMGGWTDCALLADAGIEAVLFGPEGRGGHSKTESVSMQSVDDLSEILFQTALEFCNQNKET